MATYKYDGNMVDYTPSGSDVTAGDVIVQNDLLGVAVNDIEDGKLGALYVNGVIEFPKATGVGTDIAAGTKVYWDESAGNATTTATSNTLIGKAVKAASTSDDKVWVKLNQ